jgi:hypothetical protein
MIMNDQKVIAGPLNKQMQPILNQRIIKSNRVENIKYLLLNALILLVIAQFDKKYFGSNQAFLILPVLAVLIILNKYFTKSHLLFIFLVFIGSHFTFVDEFGGTFSIVAMVVLVFYFIQNTKMVEFVYRDRQMNFYLFILMLFSICGWIFKSQLTTIHLVFSVIAFFSFISMFFVSSRIIWSPARIRLFLMLVSVIMIYALFTAIVNTRNIMPFSSTLWFSYDVIFESKGSFFYSMIQRPTTAVGAMYFTFLFPFYLTRIKNYHFGRTKQLIIFGLISSALVCILGFSKSHTVVLIAGFILTPLLLISRLQYKANIVNKYLRFIALALFLFIITEPFFHFETLIKRFEQQPGLINNFIKNPFLPKNTSREESFEWGQESLIRENWFIGYGYANGWNNRLAWFGESFIKSRGDLDFHNSYYSLPQLFGWIGSLAYLLLFIVTIRRMYRVFTDNKVIQDYRVFSFSFFMLFIIHLMTEYSITALSSPHYLMMLFILLGLANSLFCNYKKGMLYQPKNE